MKLSRSDPYRRRRSPIFFIAIAGAMLLVAILAFAWKRGGSEPKRTIEIAIPAEQLGR